VNPRRLYRSRRDRMLAGVAGGIANYLEIDPTVIRILWILSVFLGGFGILLYIIMAFIVPLEPLPGSASGPWQGPGSANATWQAPGPAWGTPPVQGAAPAAAPTGAANPAPGAAQDDEATASADAGARPAADPGEANAAWTAPNPGWVPPDPTWTAASPAWAAPGPDPRRDGARPGRAGLVFGVLLVVFGAIALVNVMVPGWAAAGLLWPAFVLALGVALVVGATGRKAYAR
jgi:phage shock protein C